MKNVFIIRLFNADYLAIPDISITHTHTHTHTHTQLALPAYFTLLKYAGDPALRAVQAECRAELAPAMSRRSLPSPERAIFGFSWSEPREACMFFIPIITLKQISIYNDKSFYHHTRCSCGAAGRPLLLAKLRHRAQKRDAGEVHVCTRGQSPCALLAAHPNRQFINIILFINTLNSIQL